jgi:hypothetical protein
VCRGSRQQPSHLNCALPVCCILKDIPTQSMCAVSPAKRHPPRSHSAVAKSGRTTFNYASGCRCCFLRAKDASTTQASLGFRVCGVRVAPAASGQVWAVDRHWGKQLTAATVGQAFTRFAGNGEDAAATHVALSNIRGWALIPVYN